MPIRILTDLQDARETVLARRPLAEPALPAHVADGVRRVFGADLSAEQAVDVIIRRVRKEGDAALADLTAKIDGVALEAFEVEREVVRSAYAKVPDYVCEALRLIAGRVREFHEKAVPKSWIDFSPEGALGQLIRPLRRVGLYSPGGTADYPSSILMQAVPARVAGVEEILVASPPRKDGLPSPLSLVAADIAGVDRVFAIGGAQAIAAMAFGTETVPPVDKILGPGNIFVALAKKKLFGVVGIDQVAGPTETLIIADESANPAWAAADLLAQAEHDPMASAVLITPSMNFAEKVRNEVEMRLKALARAEIARRSLAANGGIVVTGSLGEAIEMANAYAPEHLCLLVEDAWSYVGQIRNAGGIFLGEHSPEVAGDYVAGPSHVMPTGGTARFSSPINIWDFLKVTSLVALNEATVSKLGPAAITIATAEGLTGHAEAMKVRLDEQARGSGEG
ncbi:MAG: histidinol dehydrogenase [Chloroflexi bacterium]|nr:histidinol dehydrogenase [Chloroflexota bacterium]